MTDNPASPEMVATRVIALHGGREAFLEQANAKVDDLNSKWSQDAALMGRILRSHLFVEHYLTRYLEAKNPALGNLSAARLTFAQKAELLDSRDANVSYLVIGLRRLNKIRNRLAHTLSASATTQDRDALLSIELFRAMRDALAAPAVASCDPIDVLESFAQHAGMALQVAADPSAGIWAQAMSGYPRNGL